MVVIGAYTHEGRHALGAVDAVTGVILAQRSITAGHRRHLQALRWARELDDEPVWALEDCRHVSRRLEQALLAAGERVVRVVRSAWVRLDAASASPASPINRRARCRASGRPARASNSFPRPSWTS